MEHLLNELKERDRTKTDQLARLRAFGLSDYCARTYLALLDAGTTDARTVARMAKVPIAKIYSTLDQLQSRGLVRAIVDSPKRYEPVEVEDFVREMSEGLHREARRLQDELPALSALFPRSGRPSTSDRGSVNLVRGRRSSLAKQRTLIAGARHDVFIVLTEGAKKRAPSVLAALHAVATPLRARVLAPGADGRDTGLASLARVADVRLRDGLDRRDGSVGYLVIDEEDLLITHFVPDDGSHQSGHDVAVHVTEEGIVRSILDVLERHWEHASPLEPRDPGDA